MQPYDPLARLVNEVAHHDALIALELCLGALTASSRDDLTAIQTKIMALLSAAEPPIDPLEHLYSIILASVRERIFVIDVALLWAKQHDPTTHVLDHAPAAWAIDLMGHGQLQRISVAHADPDEQTSDGTITMLVNHEPLEVRLLPDDSVVLGDAQHNMERDKP